MLKDPISGDNPFGIYLKGEVPLYRSLRGLFSNAQTAFRALMETDESLKDNSLLSANIDAWQNLSVACEDTLIKKTKDVEVFVWYIAAQVHGKEPLLALQSAFEVMVDYIENDWEKLHPTPPDEKLQAQDDEGRFKEVNTLKLRLLISLFGEVPQSGLLRTALVNLPLIGNITYRQFVLAERSRGLDPLQAKAREFIQGDNERLHKDTEVISSLLSLSNRLAECLKQISQSIEGPNVPVYHFEDFLKNLLRMIDNLTEGTGFKKTISPLDQISLFEEENGNVRQPSLPPSVTPKNSKEEALQRMADLAHYFRETEPHSPIHLLLERAVRWSHMSIVELYKELLGDGSASYNQLSVLVGLESFNYSVTSPSSHKVHNHVALSQDIVQPLGNQGSSSFLSGDVEKDYLSNNGSPHEEDDDEIRALTNMDDFRL